MNQNELRVCRRTSGNQKRVEWEQPDESRQNKWLKKQNAKTTSELTLTENPLDGAKCYKTAFTKNV